MSAGLPSEPRPIDERNFRLAMRLLGLFFEHYLKARVSGREHLPPPGLPTIIVANHSSTLDVFAMGYALHRPGYFIAKAEATRVPLFGRFILSVGAVPANRDQRDTAALKAVLKVLKAGGTVGLAPEGTRSRDGRLGDYDPGFIWLALHGGARVVPAAIHGAWALMPRGARWPRRGSLWIRFGPALDLSSAGRLPRERQVALAAELRGRTLAMLGDLAAESGLPSPALAGGALEPAS